MSLLTIVALALVVVVVVAVLRTHARGRREPQLPPGDLEPTKASVDAQPARPAPRTEPPQPAEPPPVESTRATIPPMVAEALASEPVSASESDPVTVRPPAHATVPPPATVTVPAPALATVPPPAPATVPPPAPATVRPPAPATVPPPAPATVPRPAPATVRPPAHVPAPAPVPVSAAVAAPAPAAAVTVGTDRASIEAGDPERKKARKLARLLVSEIKLYNEKLVAEGFAAGDLYTRLKDPIDQSIVVFKRRVPEAVRAEFDYMHDELVRQFAAGDASKLGAHYASLRQTPA